MKGAKNEISTLSKVFRKGIYFLYKKVNQCARVPITWMKFLTYEINTLPEHFTQGKISYLAPFTSKSADFYETVRVKGAEKQAVSLHNGPEKQAVSLC